jgi:ATPase associated with various cellular activities AAA_5
MNKLSDFKEFYLRVILPNTPSYRSLFNEHNFDKNINELIQKYQDSYGFNPFDDVSLEDLDKKPINNVFESYSNSKGNGVPRAIINKHYKRFLRYKNVIFFENLQELVDKINEVFRRDNFIEKFQKTRIEFNGNSRVASNDVIFGSVRDDYWTINKGSEKELQYHINNDGEYIRYGLGFNAQASQNNHTPMEYVIPFVESFINKEIYDKLQDYQFVNSSFEDFKNISYGDFILFGKEIEFKKDKNRYSIEGIKLLELIYDLEGKQFEAYKLIFSNANLIKENKMNTESKIQKYINLLHYKPQIILQGPPGTGKTREAKCIARMLLGLAEDIPLEGNEQFKLIQFHPSYSYEDFVRGIVAKPNEEGDGIVYTAENKVLAEFAKKALNNWNKAQQDTQTQKEQGVFEAFIEYVKEELAQNEDYKYPLTESIYIFDADDKRFKYKGDNWEAHRKGLNMNYIDIKRIIESGIKDRQGITKLTNIGGLARQHASYFLRIIEKYYEFRKNYKPIIDKIPLKNFVLIIDEINRANLSAVLGELIYALEYRGEAVQSMYTIDEDNSLVLPPNLYIIGTMNTADRSVGHIDYAIRRRFAFVNVLPKDLTSELGNQFESTLFAKVTNLFNTNLSSEFKKEDVQLGHSYFITEHTPIDIRWEYEIKPILLEYVKDGILIGEGIEEKINSLTTV